MSDDVVFGEVQMAEPEKALRPDRNKHYAVVALDAPAEGELPIYIDLDVFRDIDTHALSDTSVELGGVLLGGQHHDDDGKPFVVITDSLRAQHYESTKGSFKFTHETWSAITKERDEFPPECQMVGWYHTHPDWGVFLSGMDLFICNNFFNKLLDVAYVVDPCRQDRGMFQWTGGRKNVTRRTGGFYLIASRFRQEELEDYVAALKEGDTPMPAVHDRSATVVNLHGQQPPWMGPAVLGMMVMQFCLLALIAWKMVEPSSSGAKDELAKLIEQSRVEERARTQKETLEAVLKDIKGTKEGYVSSLQTEKEKAAELKKKLTVAEEIAALREQSRNSALNDLAEMKDEKAGLAAELEKSKASREKLKDQLASLEKQLRPEETPKEGDEKTGGPSRTTLMVLAGCIAVLAVAGGLTAVMQSRNANSDDQPPPEDGHEHEIVASRVRPPAASPPPAAADEAVNSLVGDPPVDSPVSRKQE